MESAGIVPASAPRSVDALDTSPELAALRDSEARYRFLAENTSDIIVRASMAGTLLYVSPAVRALGYEPEALVGTSAHLLVHADDLQQFLANMAALEAIDPSTRRSAVSIAIEPLPGIGCGWRAIRMWSATRPAFRSRS